jgi:hypothetical protein
MDMTGGRGPGTIAVTLDKMNLSDEQRRMLYPALAQFLADLQEFRLTMASLPAGARGAAARGIARGSPAAPAVARGVAATRGSAQGAGDDSEKKVTTPEDVQAANDALHASAGKLKAVIKQTLPEKDAASLFDALEKVQVQRLFANP